MIISGPFVFTRPSPRFQGTPGGLGATSWTGPYAVTGAAGYPCGPDGLGFPGATGATAATGFPGNCTV